MSRAAMQQALEALIPLANAGCPNERECLTDEDHERAAEAVEALEQALAEPEQEPVAWTDGRGFIASHADSFPRGTTVSPLYAHPPTPQPLTDEEIALISAECAASAHRHDDFSFARAIIAAYEKKQGEQT